MTQLHFYPFLLPLLIFAFWGLVGYAALTLLRTQRNMLQNLLIAPSVGIAITLLPVFWLNRIGIPVGNFASILSLSLLVMSILIFLGKKPLFPHKKYLPFIGIFILALWLTGRPLINVGFNWISYANDDMANYCLSALRFLHHGYFEIPSLDDLLTDRDASLYYWFMYVPSMGRSGADLLLAWLSGMTHLNPLQIFMPLILAFHLSLISATAALVYQNKSLRLVSLMACLFLAFSPLNSLGTLSQLIAQVVGIALLITAMVLILQPFIIHQKYNILKQSLLIGITTAALLICYPEVIPFLFLSIIIYFLINLFQHWKPNQTFWLTFTFTAILLLIFLNTYWLNIFTFLIHQIHAGMQSTFADIFPYFLLPSGVNNFWGIQPLGIPRREPFQSIGIFLAIMLLAFTFIMTIRHINKKSFQPVFVALLVMLSLSLVLFMQNSGFGLFKLAMYLQPFICTTVAIIVFSLITFKYIRYLLIFPILIQLHTQYKYVYYSYGKIDALFSELPNNTHLTDEIKLLTATIPSNQSVILDIHSVVPAKLLALYLSGTPIYFYSNNFFKNIGRFTKPAYSFKSMKDTNDIAKILSNEILKKYTPLSFSMKDLNNPQLNNNFEHLAHNAPKDSLIIVSAPNRTILNTRNTESDAKDNFNILPLSKLYNHLVFINSSLGQDYYLGKKGTIALRNFENDIFFKDHRMLGLGEHLLFQILNPSPKVRLVLTITNTNTPDKNELLPPAAIIGNERKLFPIVGKGSARVFSPLITPQMIDGNPFIMLDMQTKGNLHDITKMGLMKLYGRNVTLDGRVISTRARDISLITEQEYATLNPPDFISHFPEHLDNSDLEYSGIYEDGWVSEIAFVTLNQPREAQDLIVKGYIPKINTDFSSDLSIFMNGKKLISKQVTNGDFTIKLPVTNHAGRKKILLQFSKSQNLSPADSRSVGAKIYFLGFANHH